MTPMGCAMGIADYLTDYFRQHEEFSDLNQPGQESRIVKWDKPVSVYAGFLPLAQTRQEQDELCPAVVIRPTEVNDRENETLVTMAAIVTTLDADKKQGCLSLYHLLEVVRFSLLTEQTVAGKYLLQDGEMRTVVPDQQPYPQWWGEIDFKIYLPQPERNIHGFVGGEVWANGKREPMG